MLPYIVLTTALLFIPNFLLIQRSKRKKRFGIFSGYISICLLAVFLLGVCALYFSMHGATKPTAGSFAKSAHALEHLQEAQAQFDMYQEEDKERWETFWPYISLGLIGLIIQFSIGFCYGVFALLTVSGRNNFYYLILFLNAMGIITAFMINR